MNERPMMDDRLTRCPHCTACFLISDADLKNAFGVARCGCCKKIFNAANHLFELETDASEALSPLSEEQESDSSAGHKPVDSLSGEQEPALPPESATPQHPVPESPNKPFSSAEDLLETLPDTPDLKLDDDELNEIREARQAPGIRKHQLEVTLTADRMDSAPSLAFPDTELQAAFAEPDTGMHFSAEPDQQSCETNAREKSSLGLTAGKPWIPAALAAALLFLILTLLWGNTRTLSESPGLSGFAEAICSFSSCDHYLPSDFDALQASQMALYEVNTQLVAELVLNNPTSDSLPFPAILLELRDRAGKVAAEVVYQPETYLKGKPFADHQLPPELPITLTFPVQANLKGIENLSVRYYPAAK